jgi:hypothetical protein
MEYRQEDMQLRGEGRLTDEVLREKIRHMRPLFGGRRHWAPKLQPLGRHDIPRPR